MRQNQKVRKKGKEFEIEFKTRTQDSQEKIQKESLKFKELKIWNKIQEKSLKSELKENSLENE